MVRGSVAESTTTSAGIGEAVTRQTSIEVYEQIKTEGLLSRMRFDVYEILFANGPATAGEIAACSKARHAAVSARLSELVGVGVASETGERICKVTGRRVLEFDVTDKLPKKLPVRRTKLAELKNQIAELERDLRREQIAHKSTGMAHAAALRELENAGCLFCRPRGKPS